MGDAPHDAETATGTATFILLYLEARFDDVEGVYGEGGDYACAEAGGGFDYGG